MSQKNIRNFLYFVMYIPLGIVMALPGPTLQFLSNNTGTATGSISLIFTLRALGYLAGSTGGGGLYDRFRGHKLFSLMLFLMGVCLFLVPLAKHFLLLLGIFFFLGLCQGNLDAGGNTLILWNNKKNPGPVLNGLHFFFGVGALSAPILVQNIFSFTRSMNAVFQGLLFLVIPMAIMYFFVPGIKVEKNKKKKSSEKIDYVIVLLIAFLLYLYVGIEVSFGGWIHTYAVKAVTFSVDKANYLTSLFWGMLTLGRLIYIPISRKTHPRKILLINLSAGLVATACLMFSFELILWVSVGFCGFLMGAIFPMVLNWGNRIVKVSGKIIGMFFIGASTGGLFLPWFIGYLAETAGEKVFVYGVGIHFILALLAAIMIIRRSAPASLKEGARKNVECNVRI